MIGSDVIADSGGLILRGLEQDLDVLQVAHGGLGVDVEFAEGLDVVAEVFDSNRPRRLPRKQIENAAADGELPADGDLGSRVRSPAATSASIVRSSGCVLPRRRTSTAALSAAGSGAG